jgi:hypothetical protein
MQNCFGGKHLEIFRLGRRAGLESEKGGKHGEEGGVPQSPAFLPFSDIY